MYCIVMILRESTNELREAAGEDPDIRLAGETDPEAFLAQIPEGAVLDEVQRLPPIVTQSLHSRR